MPKIYIIGMINPCGNRNIHPLLRVELLKKIILKSDIRAHRVPFPDTWILEDFDEDYEQLKYALLL